MKKTAVSLPHIMLLVKTALGYFKAFDADIIKIKKQLSIRGA